MKNLICNKFNFNKFSWKEFVLILDSQ